MLDHYRMFAAYNAWANCRVYDAAAKLSDAAFRALTGAAFGSVHATLNHLLGTDRIWLKRFTGAGDAPTTLDAILFDAFEDLRAAREAEDVRLTQWIASLSLEDLGAVFTYTPVSIPQPITQPLAPCLAHLFNHQTHHRGQCHMILTTLGQPSLVLDLVAFLRTPDGAAWAVQSV